MNKELIAEWTVEIKAPSSEVWNALVSPSIIKKYLYGTEVITDWKPGNEILFQGRWEGKEYRDKGIILRCEPETICEYTYWSSFSRLEDREENYSIVTFTVRAENATTHLKVTQKGFASIQARDHSLNNWRMVLDAMKKIIENTN
jgi:uncharacterized protein YndB with AHSA1/START domain